jgi:hypothetical protein
MTEGGITTESNLGAGLKIKKMLPSELSTRLPELPSEAFIPMEYFHSADNTQQVSDEVISEIQRASLTTLKMLGVDISLYQHDVRFTDLVDVHTKNDKGELLLDRTPGANQQMLAIMLSGDPLYDDQGHVQSIYQTKDNMVYVNLGQMDKYVTGPLPIHVKTGIAMVEETIHYVQREYWGNTIKGNMDTTHDVVAHGQDPNEQEMERYRSIICKALYPNVKLEIPGTVTSP